MKYIIAPLDRILHIVFPTKEQRLLQHARKLEIALEQSDTREAMTEFRHMMRLYHDLRDTTPNTQRTPGKTPQGR